MMTTARDFYAKLSGRDRKRYDCMLDSVYILTRVDACAFTEIDELGKATLSISFLHSIRNAKRLWGMGWTNYPQGSLSANRQYLDALTAYHGGELPQSPEFNYLASGLRNFLRLRRDDSGHSKTLLFGSSYSIADSRSGKSVRRVRNVEVSLRHSAMALSQLMSLDGATQSAEFYASLRAFAHRAERYSSSEEREWLKDDFAPLTCAAVIRTCTDVGALCSEFHDAMVRLVERFEKLLLAPESIADEIGGTIFRFPSPQQNGLCLYEFYLTTFVLALVPQLMADRNIQRVIISALRHVVTWNGRRGLPIQRTTRFGKSDPVIPDFGTTVSFAHLLWHCIAKGIGEPAWQQYCLKNFAELMSFCLASFDAPEVYVLPYNETVSKALLLPHVNTPPSQARKIDAIIEHIQHAIAIEMDKNDGKLDAAIEALQMGREFRHVCDLIRLWQISAYYRKERESSSDKTGRVLDLTRWGNFAGGFVAGMTKSFSES